MFIYGQDIPLDDVESPEPADLPNVSVQASEFPFEYGRNIFLTEETE